MLGKALLIPDGDKRLDLNFDETFNTGMGEVNHDEKTWDQSPENIKKRRIELRYEMGLHLSQQSQDWTTLEPDKLYEIISNLGQELERILEGTGN